jgi:hypothetical protein
MKLAWITSAALALGVSAAIPTMTKADERYRDRDSDRFSRRDVERHEYRDRDFRDRDFRDRDIRDREVIVVREVPTVCVDTVSFCDVPSRVQDRVNEYRHGRGIQLSQRVSDQGRTFYQFSICDTQHGDFTLQIEPSGHLFARLDR